jgi:hypothetical protein
VVLDSAIEENMESRVIPLRIELLNVLDQQIEMLASKTFAAFTREEMGVFRNREQRIRELQQQLTVACNVHSSESAVFSMVYN